MAGNVDIILADEPTAALDTTTGQSVMELLKEETRAGKKACFVVTHDPRLERFATRVDRITDGTLSVGMPPRIRSAGPGNESGSHAHDHHRPQGPVLANTTERADALHIRPS
jgi:ABC-type lipoprotein export system ATPase subunit